MSEKNLDVKQKYDVVSHQNSPQGSVSFWNYETKEDRLARNLWIYFMIGLVTFSCLIFCFNVFNA